MSWGSPALYALAFTFFGSMINLASMQSLEKHRFQRIFSVFVCATDEHLPCAIGSRGFQAADVPEIWLLVQDSAVWLL